MYRHLGRNPTWKTSTEVTIAFEVFEESYTESTLPFSTYSCPEKHKVLRVQWNVAQDQLLISLDGIVETTTQVDMCIVGG